jgi:hypothetical protein
MITNWEGRDMPTDMMTTLQKIASALGLNPSASRAEIADALAAFLDSAESADAPTSTAPARLAELVERICVEENVAFNEGLTRAKAREPRLVEDVAAHYRHGR